MNQNVDFGIQLHADGGAQVQGQADVAAASLAKVSVAATGVGNSTKLSAYQVTQLSNQLQDLAVQIQSGGNPLTALLQQGSQLSAVFGGTGNALRAMVSLVNPTTAALTALAVAAGGVSVAVMSGERQQEAFVRSLVTTGNASGQTTGQLRELARAAASFTTSGKAADVLAQLAGTGLLVGSSLARATEAAIRFEREGGASVQQTVKAFADLGRSPVEALLRLNESQNFLSMSAYRQVKALQDQGKEAQAAAVAQEVYANALIGRSKEMESQLGDLERVWRAVGDGAKWAWDKMLNIGRPATLETQLAELQAKLSTAEAAPEGQRSQKRQEFIADAKQRIEALRLEIYLQREAAQAQADAADAVQAGIAKDKAAAAARKKLAEETARLVESGRQLVQSMDLQGAGFDPNFLSQMKALAAYAKASGMSTASLADAQQRLIAQQPVMQAQARAATEAAASRSAARRAEEKAINDYVDASERERKVSLDAVNGRARSLEDEIAAMQMAAAQNMVLAQAVEQVAIARLRERQANYIEGSEPWRAVEREIDARRKLMLLIGNKAAMDESMRAAQQSAQDWQRTANDIRSALTDSFRDAFMSGEDFGTAMAKTVAAEMKARLATAAAEAMAIAVMQAAGLQFVQMAGGSSGGGSSLFQTASGAASIYNAGGSATGLAGSALAAGNYGAVYSGQAYGTAFGSQQSAMLAAQESGMVSQAGASAMSGWGAYAGWAALAIAAAMQGSSDYSAGFRRQQAKESGTALGDASAKTAQLMDDLAISDRIADIISGATLTARAFGRAAPRAEAQGFSGTIGGAGDFTGQWFTDMVEKGGWFRSDKRYTQFDALPEQLGRFLDDAAGAVFAKAKEFGKALGLPAEQLSNVSADIKVALTDDATKNQEAIAEAIGGYGDKLVETFAEAVKPLQGYGETTAQTIARVGAAIGDVNDVLQALGLKALQASIDGGKAAVSLEAIFGGIEGFRQTAGSFAQNFYSETERAAMASQSIAATLAAAGLQMPASRAELRATVEQVVETTGLLTESGRQQFAALMSVQQAFADLVPAERSAADILSERVGLEEELLRLQGDTAALRARELDALDPSNRALQQQIYALEDQKAAAEAAADAMSKLNGQVASLSGQLLSGVSSAFDDVRSQIESAKSKITSDADRDLAALEQRASGISSAYTSLFNSLDQAIAQLTGRVSKDGGRSSATAVLQQALSDLRRGRRVDMDAVRTAAGDVTKLNTGDYGTRQQYEQAVAQAANVLREVNAAAHGKLTGEMGAIAAQQVAIEASRDAQLKALDEQLKAAEAAAGTLISIDKGVHSVAEAVDALAMAIAAVNAANGTAGGPVGQWMKSGGAEVYRAAGGATAARAIGAGLDDTLIRGLSGQIFTAAQARDWVNGRIAAGDFAGIVARAIAEGVDSSALDAIMGVPPGTSAEEARRRHLPSFAVGSPYIPADTLANVHAGERIFTAPENHEVMRLVREGAEAGAVARELRAVREEVERLRRENAAAQRAIAINTARTNSALEEVVYGEAPLMTKAVT